jgi:hypothetical protein
MNVGTPVQMRWALSVAWHDSVLPNDATVRDWITAIGGGKVLLPAESEPVGYPNPFTAQLVVEAATLRQALTAGLARVEKGVHCKALDVRATLIQTCDRDEDVFATHGPVTVWADDPTV